MKPRLVFVALLAGLLASQILSFVFKDIWPGYIAPQFMTPGSNSDLAWIFYAGAALLIFAGGYAAARLEWARDGRDAILQGVHVGLLAGCLAYLFSYAPVASGLMGQKEILLSVPRTIADDQEGLKLLIQGVVNTVVWAQVFFWVFMLASMILGGLGGLLSRLEGSGGWGKAPAPKAPLLPRLTVYGLGFFATFNLIVTVSAMGIMPGAIGRANIVGPMDGLLLPSWATFVLPLTTAMAFFIVCLIFIMQWAFESWRYPEKRFRLKISLVIFSLALLPLLVTVSYQLAWLTLAVLAVIGLVLWLVQRFQHPAVEQEPGNTQPYNVWDVLVSAITQGIVFGAVTVGSVIAHALTLVLITIVNVSHLMKTGPLESTAQEQIASLYTTSIAQNIPLVLVSSLVGLIIVAVGLGVEKWMQKTHSQPAEIALPSVE